MIKFQETLVQRVVEMRDVMLLACELVRVVLFVFTNPGVNGGADISLFLLYHFRALQVPIMPWFWTFYPEWLTWQ